MHLLIMSTTTSDITFRVFANLSCLIDLRELITPSYFYVKYVSFICKALFQKRTLKCSYLSILTSFTMDNTWCSYKSIICASPFNIRWTSSNNYSNSTISSASFLLEQSQRLYEVGSSDCFNLNISFRVNY